MKTVLVLALFVLAAVAKLNLNRPAVNMDMIRRINSKNGGTWKAGVNSKFVNQTLAFAKTLCGVRRGGPKLPLAHIEPANDIPESYDPRDDDVWGTKCPGVKEVRDQSACGSCWAISAAEVMTDRWCIMSDGAESPELSAQDITSCCSDCGDGCHGGYPSAAFEYWVETGVVTGGSMESDQGCYPYALPMCDHHVHGKYPDCGDTEDTPECTNECKHGEDWDEDKHKGVKAYRVSSDVEAIQTELMQHGPIDAAFAVYEDFLAYKEGVYQHQEGSELGLHAVKLIGWGTEDGTDFWIVINSWNEDWGDNGQFKILRGSDECGIESDLCTALPPKSH